MDKDLLFTSEQDPAREPPDGPMKMNRHEFRTRRRHEEANIHPIAEESQVSVQFSANAWPQRRSTPVLGVDRLSRPTWRRQRQPLPCDQSEHLRATRSRAPSAGTRGSGRATIGCPVGPGFSQAHRCRASRWPAWTAPVPRRSSTSRRSRCGILIDAGHHRRLVPNGRLALRVARAALGEAGVGGTHFAVISQQFDVEVRRCMEFRGRELRVPVLVVPAPAEGVHDRAEDRETLSLSRSRSGGARRS